MSSSIKMPLASFLSLRRWAVFFGIAALFVPVMICGAPVSSAIAADGGSLRVVTSLRPVQALVASVMEGVAVPDLLVTNPVAAHDFTLRPNQARLIQDADILFWIGPPMERALTPALSALAANGLSIRLIDVEGLRLHETAIHDHDSHQHDLHDSHPISGVNPHIWLDTGNLALMFTAVADSLSKIDVRNAVQYRANAARAIADLKTISDEIKPSLAPLSGVGYAVLHDAHIYFESSVGLRARAILTTDPDVPPKISQIRAIRQQIKAGEIACLFSEVGVPTKAIDVVAADHHVEIKTLDPLGSQIAANNQFFSNLLRDYATAFKTCLGGKAAVAGGS